MNDRPPKKLILGPAFSAGGAVVLLLLLGLHAYDNVNGSLSYLRVDAPLLVVSFVSSVLGVVLALLMAFRERRAQRDAGVPPGTVWQALSVVGTLVLALVSAALGAFLLFWSLAYRLL